MAATKSFPILFLLIQLCGMSSGRLIGGRNLRSENVTRDGNDESDHPRRIFFTKLSKRKTIATAQIELNASKESNEIPNDPRIIGGSLSTKGRYPYAVSLNRAGGHFCGGSLIAKDVVLSAAHCAGSNYNVVVGRHSLNIDEGEIISVKGQVLHPQYTPSRTDNDFLLIFLSRPTNADLVSLNSNSATPNEGDSVTAMGWGDTVASNSYTQLSNTLREVEVKVLSNQKCAQSNGNVGGVYNSYYGSITGNMLCAKDLGEVNIFS